MEGGKAVATATHAELMEREPRYAAVLAHADEGRPPNPPQAPEPPHARGRRMIGGRGPGEPGVPDGGFPGGGL